MPANQVVNFTSTFVVCAPKMFSVTAPPNAAPKPSLFGRCIRITSTMSSATSTKNTRNRLIRRFIGTGNISKAQLEANVQNSTFRIEFRNWALRCGRWALEVVLELIPDRIQLHKIDVAESLALPSQLVLQ